MKKGLENKPINERFRHLLSVIRSKRFLEKKGLGNEIPFFICPFPPDQAVDMARMQSQLVNSLEKVGIRILSINLYDLSIELLKKRGIWEQILEREEAVEKEQLKELLQGVLDPETHLVPAVAEKMTQKQFHVMFISGVGEVFPYIRSHSVLNNLQATVKEHPVLMFFPGQYAHNLEHGASLNLFNRLYDDKYYRAFNIYHYQL